ncbi:MAG: dTMP kinase [Acidimicrobiia bacterium]|nr:dTMP kinase [Acidimicrobiia bacterium]
MTESMTTADDRRRGRYIALEGIEGAGKSTVANHIVARLTDAGIDALGVREPGGTGAGERIRDILLDTATELGSWGEAMLFAAARAQLAAERIGPALSAGTWIVSDRSVYSSLAYQGGGRGLGIEAVRAVNEAGLCGVWPDLVIVLRVDPARGLARQEVEDRIGAEGIAFQQQVADAFDRIAAQDPDRVVNVDAMRTVGEVVDEVYGLIQQRLGSVT